MKPIVATLLAVALSTAFSTAYAIDDNAKPDTASYRHMTEKAAADYKVAAAKCTGMSGNERAVCVEEAKVERARINAEAVAQHNNTSKARTLARTALANASHALAMVKCSVTGGTEKASCLSDARAVHSAALADAKADRDVRVAATAATPTIAQRTENAADTAVQKTKDAAAVVADKSERAVDKIAEGTGRAVDKTGNAAAKTGKVIADSVITTKVKADLFKEPELSSMAIHVETDKGIVMLSGFVDSKADADKAERLARSVEGVTEVKSAIKVK
jgi:hyperosmotically inducible protein